VVPPTEVFCGLTTSITEKQWCQDTVEKIRRHTDRPIVVRHKPKKRDKFAKSFEEDLNGCHAVVTCNSKAGVEAIVAGYPVFASYRCGVSTVACDDLSKIEDPRRYGARKEWLWALAANQWTIPEMSSGRCYEEVSKDLQEELTIRPNPDEPIDFLFG